MRLPRGYGKVISRLLGGAAGRYSVEITLLPAFEMPAIGDFGTDKQNLAQDWENVGNDLRKAIAAARRKARDNGGPARRSSRAY